MKILNHFPDITTPFLSCLQQSLMFKNTNFAPEKTISPIKRDNSAICTAMTIECDALCC